VQTVGVAQYKVPHGEDLREMREAKGLSRKDIADELDVWPQTVQRWESEDRWPPRETLTELLEILQD